MNSIPNVSTPLARFLVESRWEHIPSDVRHAAKRALLNYFGAAFGGCRDDAIETCVRVLAQHAGAPAASVIGRTERFDTLSAAFLNGASANVQDFDDTHLRTVIHPTSPIAPALLAFAERVTVDGAALLHALVLGVEVACRVGNAVSPGHYARGWHITSTCGVIGAAAGVAKLLRLDPARMQAALGLGANQACGLVESLGSMAKSISVGNAPRNGLLSAQLAEQGFTAAPRTLEGERGFVHVLGEAPDIHAIDQGLGQHWEISNNALKAYPSGVVLHAVVDACLELRSNHGLPADDIRSVTVAGSALLRQRADRPHPRSGREASVSAQHTVAACFLHGAAGVRQYTDACVNEPAMQAFGTRVSVVEDTAMPVGAARVSVETQSGARFTAEVEHALGSLQRPMTDARIEAKLRELADMNAPTCPTARLIEAVWSLDRSTDAGAVMRLAVPQD